MRGRNRVRHSGGRRIRIHCRKGGKLELVLDKASDLPLHRQIRRQFTRLIGQNRLVVGDSLPSTREIARDLGISRLTVLKAFQAMERAGIVGVRPGRGYFVKHRQSETEGEKNRLI